MAKHLYCLFIPWLLLMPIISISLSNPFLQKLSLSSLGPDFLRDIGQDSDCARIRRDTVAHCPVLVLDPGESTNTSTLGTAPRCSGWAQGNHMHYRMYPLCQGWLGQRRYFIQSDSLLQEFGLELDRQPVILFLCGMAGAMDFSGAVGYAIHPVSWGSGNARLQSQGSEAHVQRESEMREGLEIIMIPSSSSFLRKAAFFLLLSVRQLGGLKQFSPFLCWN